MATITEDYVSFETAKLLKEKGFNGTCWSWYHNGNHTITGTSKYCNNELDKHDYSKPTQQMACKWLREVHNIYIEISIHEDGFITIIKKFKNGTIQEVRKSSMPNQENSFEEQMEWEIRFCLKNLI